ncbi:MAG: hypothetical protein KC475_04175 [Cyanobacteria bacterium HKST-UBA03]|nr:hypothetical protein [Cyanobacteria bacterium HKST-UBA03]
MSLWGGLAVKGYSQLDTTYDSLWYHLPFAGRLAGLVSEADYTFDRLIASRFDGYPMLAEALQALLWRVTGRIQSANLVGWGFAFGLSLFLWRRFSVPWTWATFGLMAIPLFVGHSVWTYVDLPYGVFVTVAILSAMAAVLVWYDTDLGRQLLKGRPKVGVFRGYLVGIVAGVTGAVYTKFGLLHLMLGLTAAVALWLAVLERQRQATWQAWAWWLATRYVPCLLLLLSVMYFPLLKNMWLHQGPPYFSNPLYPVALKLPFVSWAGPDPSVAMLSPKVLAGTPPLVLWLASVFGSPYYPDATGMLHHCSTLFGFSCWDGSNGFARITVIANLVLLVLNMGLAPVDRASKWVVGGFMVVLTLVVGNTPSLHVLRYAMAWMFVLVAVNLNLLGHTLNLNLLGHTLNRIKGGWSPWDQWRRCMAGSVLLLLCLAVYGQNLRYYFLPVPVLQHWPAELNRELVVFVHALQKHPDRYKRLCLGFRAHEGFAFSHYFHPDVPFPYQIQTGACSPDAVQVTPAMMDQWARTYERETGHRVCQPTGPRCLVVGP